MTHHLVGVSEIAAMFGVSRQRVHQLAADPDFPAPAVVLKAGSVWEREAIEAWGRANRPPAACRRLTGAP